MNVVIKGIRDALVADATLTGLIATYASAPAVFSGDFVPEDCEPAWAFIYVVSDQPTDSKNGEGRELNFDVSVWARKVDGPKHLNTIAERVRDLLHRTALTISGYEHLLSVASGPIQNEPDEALIGRTVSVRILIDKE